VAALGKEGRHCWRQKSDTADFPVVMPKLAWTNSTASRQLVLSKRSFAELGGLGFGQVEKLGVRSGFLGGGVWLGFHGF